LKRNILATVINYNLD